MDVIQTHNLSFRYKQSLILDNIELRVPQNSIYGYLGKNGAGKTTTIKLLLGLLNTCEGSIFINGKDLNSSNRCDILKNVGNLIESPCYYPNLSVWENLLYLDTIFRLGKKRINDVLELVGLENEREKCSMKLSTGMKQRLGIAMSIYRNPSILLLDEPLNGLDPQGIHDMRYLLKELNKRGTTILLSSHIISELEKICTHVGILDNGRLKYQGSLESLLSNVKHKLLLKVDDVLKTQEVCNDLQIDAKIETNRMIHIWIDNEDIHNKLIRGLTMANINIYSIESSSGDLESVFFSYIERI